MDRLTDAWAPRILGAGVRERMHPWRKPWRRLPCWLLVATGDGPETLRLADRMIAIPSGGCYVVPPDTAHALASPGNRPAFVHLDLVQAGDRAHIPDEESWPAALPPPADMAVQPGATDVLGVVLPVVVPMPWAARFRRALPRIATTWTAGGSLERVRAAMDAAALLVDWAISCRAVAGVDPLARAEAAVRADPAGMDLGSMATAAGLRPSRFCERYRAARGQAPGAYLRNERLARAKELLAETDLPLADIAVRCGWATPSTLIRAFRSACGSTPDDWRRAQTGGSSGSRAHTRSR
jgi:AraC-like DNA-binding protein